MKAIILAAGRGSRMGEQTDEKPKCLIPFRGRPLLDWQLDALRGAGITDIAIVTGYLANLLSRQDIKFFHNERWNETNMVASLVCANQWLANEPCIVSYSDIFYSETVVTPLSACKDGLAILFDPNWLALWKKRFSNPLDDAETFRKDSSDYLLEIGNRPDSVDEIEGQYVGLLKFTPKSWITFLRVYNGLSLEEKNSIHMTGMLNRVIEDGEVAIKAVPGTDEWWEFDSQKDIEIANLPS